MSIVLCFSLLYDSLYHSDWLREKEQGSTFFKFYFLLYWLAFVLIRLVGLVLRFGTCWGTFFFSGYFFLTIVECTFNYLSRFVGLLLWFI